MKTAGKVNNAIYEEHGDGWWDENAEFGFSSLRYCVNPVRYGYFKRCLDQLAISGKDILDVGCGGGFLSEEFARDGYRVTGIDPSARTVGAARRHALESGLEIRYGVGRGEEIPFAGGSFDIVACCDVLEHVDDPQKVIEEVSRLLKPGGAFLYDTVNRTWLSKIGPIKVWQEWAFTKCCPENTHVWEKFIKPVELIEMMRKCGLVNRGLKGIAPRHWNPIRMLRFIRALKAGKVSNAEMADAMGLAESDGTSLSYMGYGIKESR